MQCYAWSNHTPLQHNTQPVNFKEWLISLNVRQHPSGIHSTLRLYVRFNVDNKCHHSHFHLQ